MMQRFCDWLNQWNQIENDDEALHCQLDSLDDIICQLIADCELKQINTEELRGLLKKHRDNSRRLLERRMDVAEELDWLLKRIAAERLATAERQVNEIEHSNIPSGDNESELHERDKKRLKAARIRVDHDYKKSWTKCLELAGIEKPSKADETAARRLAERFGVLLEPQQPGAKTKDEIEQ